MLTALLVPLSLAILAFAFVLARSAIAKHAMPNFEAGLVGAIVSFFDTLGIGSFAPTTAWMKFRKVVPDRLIPPTMLVGLTPPAMAQSIIFLIILGVFVDPVLLVGCVIALLMGGLLGAPLVAKTRVWIVQLVVAIALLLAAAAYTMTNLELFPGGGTASSLPMTLTIVAIAANFPIMAGGAALTGAGASIRHIMIGQIDLRIVLGLAIGGIPAVLVAAFIVGTMPLEILRWLVIVVVLYAAAVMFRAAWLGRRAGKSVSEQAAMVL